LSSATGRQIGAEAAGFVLAGGRSSRMGTDKALVELNGALLIVRALRILQEAGLESAVAGARSDLSAYACVIEDRLERGPLSGICAALGSTSAEFSVFISVDMPLLPPVLVGYLVEHAQETEAGITLVSVNGFVQTFPAVIHRSLAPVLDAELQNGDGGCVSAFRVAAERECRLLRILPLESLVQAGQVEDPRGLPAAFWFVNANTAEDLAQGERLLRRSVA